MQTESQDLVAEALRLVLRDIRATEGIEARVTPRIAGDNAVEFQLLTPDDPEAQGWTRVVPRSGEPRAELTATVARVVQDLMIERLWRAWPECPDHAHPLSVTVDDGEAAWRCEVSGSRAPIGALRQRGER